MDSRLYRGRRAESRKKFQIGPALGGGGKFTECLAKWIADESEFLGRKKYEMDRISFPRERSRPARASHTRRARAASTVSVAPPRLLARFRMRPRSCSSGTSLMPRRARNPGVARRMRAPGSTAWRSVLTLEQHAWRRLRPRHHYKGP